MTSTSQVGYIPLPVHKNRFMFDCPYLQRRTRCGSASMESKLSKLRRTRSKRKVVAEVITTARLQTPSSAILPLQRLGK